MANNPKKVKDPTEVALSAIQEALNISDTSADTGRSAPRDEHDHDEVAPPVPPASPSFEPVFEARPPRMESPSYEPMEEPRTPIATRRPANDDRETIGQILQAIQKGRPARNVYTLASLFAGVWIIGCVLLTIFALPSLQASMSQG